MNHLITFQSPASLRMRLKAEAKLQDRSLSHVIREKLKASFPKKEKAS